MVRCSYIDDYIAAVRTGAVPSSKEIKQAVDYIAQKLANPDVLIDTPRIEKAKELIERYFRMQLFDWELFVLALIHCYYRSSDTVVFGEFLIMMGRGNGKNGFISTVTCGQVPLSKISGTNPHESGVFQKNRNIEVQTGMSKYSLVSVKLL